MKENEIVDIYSKGCALYDSECVVEVSCDEIGNKVKEGDYAYYGDRTVDFHIESIVDKDHIRVRTINSGKIEHSKAFVGSNTLNCNMDNLKVALNVYKEAGCTGIAFSFVENAEQLKEIKKKIS